ncbi:hypothetical protein C1H46_005758 [Malus baccata]|uniref:Uncharacterized protein n=1 Tax=Malus baccata TaxID=106549 RepID=A0A540NC13_MALBA|nr:hypothetical protein C1H46_005758 [Malus baccata]
MAVADQGFLLFYFNGRLGFGLEAFVLEGHQSHTFSFPSSRTMTLGTYLITPAMGSHFVIYLAKMQGERYENACTASSKDSGLPDRIAALLPVLFYFFLYMLPVLLVMMFQVDSYAYLPSNVDQSLRCDASAALVVFKRRHVSLENQSTELIFGSTAEQPLLETPGEVFQLRKLIPASIFYDFNIHEVHDNQHGLLLLEGQDIYRLGDSWYEFHSLLRLHKI